MKTRPFTWCLVFVLAVALVVSTAASSRPIRARHGMVVAAEPLETQIGLVVLQDGGSAVDAAVATAFALAVTYPFAGNIGGGGFMLVRSSSGDTAAYDFREVAPAGASPEMFLVGGEYDRDRHHNSHLAVGVPGTVSGLYLAWSEQGDLPWNRLVQPAIALARDGFVVSHDLAASLEGVLGRMTRYPAALA